MDMIPWLRAAWSLQHPGPHSRDVLRAYETDQHLKVLPHSPNLSIQRSRTPLVPHSGLQEAPCGPLSSSQKSEHPATQVLEMGTARPACLSQLHAEPCLLSSPRLQRAQAFTSGLSPLSPFQGGDKGVDQQQGVSGSARACYTVASSELTQEFPNSEAFL